MKSIILLGIKHCGKSTQGKLLSKHFNCPFFDTDDEITFLTGKTPREIYSENGKEAFLQAEKNACENLVKKTENEDKIVIATGGGICNNNEALEILHKNGTFIFMNADEETAVSRIIREIKYDDDCSMKNLPAYIAKENPANIADVRRIFHNFYEKRQKLYKSLCDIQVDLEHNSSKQDNLNKILNMISF